MLDPFTIHQPKRVAEASDLLVRYGDDAAIYAGGTELLIVMKERLAHFPHLVDIKGIPGLREISFDATSGELTIGALATHREIERSSVVRERIPALAALEAAVANVRVRVAGTIGGNLCFAEPHSDPATLLSALDARLTLESASGSREVPVAAFITSLMETVRRHDEILTRITIPGPGPATGVAYERFKLHERPTAAVAAVITVDHEVIVAARVVAGCIGERPQRLIAVEAALAGQFATTAISSGVASIIQEEVTTTSDAFESEAYKRQLAQTVGARAIAAAMLRATGEEGGHHAA